MARKKKETKALVKKDANLPSVDLFDKDLFDAQEIDNEDILIPKMWLMQQMSEMVVNKSADSGEYRDSLTGELLETPLEVFIFSPYKTWQVTNTPKGKKRADYVETLNYYENKDLPIEEEEKDGSITHRDKVLGFFCLIANDINSDPFPYVIDFKRTSRRTGQSIVTKMAKLRSAKLPCYATTFIIGGYLGSKLSIILPENIIRKVFAIFLVFIAIKMFFSK